MVLILTCLGRARSAIGGCSGRGARAFAFQQTTHLMKGCSARNTEQMRTLLNALDDPDAMLETLNLSFNDQLERDNMAQLSESPTANTAG